MSWRVLWAPPEKQIENLCFTIFIQINFELHNLVWLLSIQASSNKTGVLQIGYGFGSSMVSEI